MKLASFLGTEQFYIDSEQFKDLLDKLNDSNIIDADINFVIDRLASDPDRKVLHIYCSDEFRKGTECIAMTIPERSVHEL